MVQMRSLMPLLSPSVRSVVARHSVVLCAVTAIAVPAESATAQRVKPFAAVSKSAHSLRDSVVAMARAQIGTRYLLGGASPENGFDCSGLVKYVMEALNLQLPRTATLQAKEGLALARDTSRLLPGDLLTFGKKSKGVSHIGIYVGNGRYVHASSTAGRVIESPIDRPVSPLIRVWKGARRVLAAHDSLLPGAPRIPAVPAVVVTPKGGTQ